MDGGNSIPIVQIISCLKACKKISKGCICDIVRVKDLEYEVPLLDLVAVLNDFLEVFPYDLYGIPPEWEIDFCIDFMSDTNPVLISPY